MSRKATEFQAGSGRAEPRYTRLPPHSQAMPRPRPPGPSGAERGERASKGECSGSCASARRIRACAMIVGRPRRHGRRGGRSSACVVSICSAPKSAADPPRTAFLPPGNRSISPAAFFGAHVGKPGRTAASAPILVAAPGRLSLMNGRPSRSCGQFAQTTKKHAQALAGYALRAAAAEVADHC